MHIELSGGSFYNFRVLQLTVLRHSIKVSINLLKGIDALCDLQIFLIPKCDKTSSKFNSIYIYIY